MVYTVNLEKGLTAMPRTMVYSKRDKIKMGNP